MHNAPTIQSSSMLLDLTISVYTGRRTDRRTAQEITTSKGAASSSATSVNKFLFAGDQDLAEINRWAAYSRDRVARITLPWDDSGTRLLPTESFFDATKELDDLSAEFYRRVDTFLATYDSKISNAAFALGALFDRSEYLSEREVRRRFNFAYTFSPVPSAGDFRVDIPQEALAFVKDTFQMHNQERVQTALNDVTARLYDVIKTMQEKCTVPEDGPKPRIYESTFNHALELCDIAKRLNIFNNPSIEAVRAELEASLKGIDIVSLRDSVEVRDSVRAKMDALMEKFV